jgi:hypothetical protein
MNMSMFVGWWWIVKKLLRSFQSFMTIFTINMMYLMKVLRKNIQNKFQQMGWGFLQMLL